MLTHSSLITHAGYVSYSDLVKGMSFGYTRSDIVLGLTGQRSRFGLVLRLGFFTLIVGA